MHIVKNTQTFLAAAVLGLACCAAMLYAQEEGMGGQPGAYLRPPVGAQAAAMGGANTASPDGLCPWWNPASLVLDKKRDLTLGGSYRSLGRTDGVLGWEMPVPPRVGLGLSVLYRGDPSIGDLYDENQNKLDNGNYTTLTFKIGLAYLVNRRFEAGANLTAYYQRLPVNYSASSLVYSSAFAPGGFDLGARFEVNDNISVGLVVKNLGASITVNSQGDYDYEEPIETKFPPVITLGMQYKGLLLKKAFIWNIDANGYVVDGNIALLQHPQCVIDNGFEWQRWEKFYIRAGVRDIALNGQIFRDRAAYTEYFSAALTAGFHLDLSSAAHGLAVDYAFATDKVWAGVENQMDVTLAF